MKLPLFVDSLTCTSGLLCGLCRDLEGGRAFRSTQTDFELPEGAPDFSCPKGKQWSHLPEIKAAASTLQNGTVYDANRGQWRVHRNGQYCGSYKDPQIAQELADMSQVDYDKKVQKETKFRTLEPRKGCGCSRSS